MELNEAKEELLSILTKVDGKDRLEFLSWASEVLTEAKENVYSPVESNESDEVISLITEDLRKWLPIDAVLTTENIVFPEAGKNSSMKSDCTIHVDKFLYDDTEVEQLCDEGKLSRYYCPNCGSTKVKPLDFISHSASLAQIKFIFGQALPELNGHKVVDVGSRLGPMLYGAYFYSAAEKIFGVEINQEFCVLQKKIVEKYNLGNKIKVICSDICHQKKLLQEADVIILNNVFEFFVPSDVHSKIWSYLFEWVRKPGVYVVSIPSIEDIFRSLQIKLDLNTWLKSIKLNYKEYLASHSSYCDSFEEQLEEIQVISLYQVIG